MNPSASAPAATAASASSTFVMPQILTRTLISTSQKLFGLGLDVPLLHQRFAHEDCPRAAASQPLDVGAFANSAFRHQNSRLQSVSATCRRPFCQSLRRSKINVECLQVAVVDADEPRVDRQSALELRYVVHFDQRGQADRKSTRLNSSHITISYAVFCLKKKKKH